MATQKWSTCGKTTNIMPYFVSSVFASQEMEVCACTDFYQALADDVKVVAMLGGNFKV